MDEPDSVDKILLEVNAAKFSGNFMKNNVLSFKKTLILTSLVFFYILWVKVR